MLTVWIPLKFQTNHNKTSISLVPRFFIVLFRLICWESQAFLPIKRKSLLSVSELELNCVITGLGQSSQLLNSAIPNRYCASRRSRMDKRGRAGSQNDQHRPGRPLLFWQRHSQKHWKQSWGVGRERAWGVKGRCASDPPRLGCVTGAEDAAVAATKDAAVTSIQHMQQQCSSRHQTVIVI